MGVGLAIIAGQYCGWYISCDKVFPDSRGPGNPTGSAQCAGSGNGSSWHTVVPLCGSRMRFSQLGFRLREGAGGLVLGSTTGEFSTGSFISGILSTCKTENRL